MRLNSDHRKALRAHLAAWIEHHPDLQRAAHVEQTTRTEAGQAIHDAVLARLPAAEGDILLRHHVGTLARRAALKRTPPGELHAGDCQVDHRGARAVVIHLPAPVVVPNSTHDIIAYSAMRGADVVELTPPSAAVRDALAYCMAAVLDAEALRRQMQEPFHRVIDGATTLAAVLKVWPEADNAPGLVAPEKRGELVPAALYATMQAIRGEIEPMQAGE